MLFSNSEITTGPAHQQMSSTAPEIVAAGYMSSTSMNNSQISSKVAEPNHQHSKDPANKRHLESFPFNFQFQEVEKAIANFTKHQPFNHHYAPNVHVNRNHHNHHNRHNNNNSNNNNGNNGNGNGRYHQNHQHHPQQNFAMNAQLKQQQQQQFLSNSVQQMNRYNNNKSMNGFNPIQAQSIPQHQVPAMQQVQQFTQAQVVPQPQQQPLYMQTQFHPQQQTAPAPQQIMGQSLPSLPQVQYSANDDLFQHGHGIPQLQHTDLMNPLRNTSPTFATAPIRPGSVTTTTFGAPLEQINSNSSFGLSNSDLLSTPITASSTNGDYVDKKLSLDDSTAYLGDIWGNSKSLRNSASVWA